MLAGSMRERVAGLLHKVGALGAVMQLRRLVPMPTLSIITYHHIADHEPGYPFDPDIADASRAQFRRQMETLARYGTPIGVDELLRALEGGPLPKNPVMVTFDDGYRSCHDVALPILQQVGVRATFFIATSFITERRLYWWERIALMLSGARRDRGTIKYPQELELDRRDRGVRNRLNALVKTTMSLDLERFLGEIARAMDVEWTPELETRHANDMIMTWDQIRALAKAGMDVESHTRRHRVLQTLDPATLADEPPGLARGPGDAARAAGARARVPGRAADRERGPDPARALRGGVPRGDVEQDGREPALAGGVPQRHAAGGSLRYPPPGDRRLDERRDVPDAGGAAGDGVYRQGLSRGSSRGVARTGAAGVCAGKPINQSASPIR